MTRQYILSGCLGFAIAVIVIDILIEFRPYFTAMSFFLMLIMAMKGILEKRRAKLDAFHKMLDTYSARHDMEVGPSEVHALNA